MNKKTQRNGSITVYQLVETPAVDDEDGILSTIYSILELKNDGDSVESNFIYDISRTRERALAILECVRRSGDEPIISVLEDVL